MSIHQKKWYSTELPSDDVVVSTRIRLARNIIDFPFVGGLASTQIASLEDIILSAWKKQFSNASLLRFRSMPPLLKKKLVEENVVDRGDLLTYQSSFLLTSSSPNIFGLGLVSDHLRVIYLSKGRIMSPAMTHMAELDRRLDKELSFAFSLELGYLNANFTDVGNGINVTLLLHIPASLSNQDDDYIRKIVSEFGFSLEPVKALRDCATQGLAILSTKPFNDEKPEKIIKRLEECYHIVINYERERKTDILSHKGLREDARKRVLEAYEFLKNSERLSSRECTEALLSLRTGAVWSLIDGFDVDSFLRLYIECQPGHIRERLEEKRLSFSREEEERERASWISSQLTRI
ncbi:hypothetical protein WKV44_10085 [Spirochaetia bacterium 38H-sp]|uniref:Phosphagen kinase C-terminal domain-containing protein n=1 Tax=Rarispira pelagica TaxID=3141764 RepID=A0ABU9UDZ7_9SPIR